MKVKEFRALTNKNIRIIVEKESKSKYGSVIYPDVDDSAVPAAVLEAEVKCIDRVSGCVNSTIAIKI